MTPNAATRGAEARACRFIADLIYERCRIRLHDGKDALIKARLGKRMRKHGFAELADYCEFLRTQPDDEEMTCVVDALTTNFTNFLREPDHFTFLVDQVLPSIVPPGRKKFDIWCAASSSGEEPYSIALYLAERYPPASGWDWRITASDISTRVLDQARLGVYPAERLHSIPRDWVRKYFQKGVGKWEGRCRIKPEIAERISFCRINLIEAYTHTQPFEIIFCRNVLIYFDRPTQEQLVRRLSENLVPNGYLLIGHSESLNGMNLPLRCLRPSVYQRSGA